VFAGTKDDAINRKNCLYHRQFPHRRATGNWSRLARWPRQRVSQFTVGRSPTHRRIFCCPSLWTHNMRLGPDRSLALFPSVGPTSEHPLVCRRAASNKWEPELALPWVLGSNQSLSNPCLSCFLGFDSFQGLDSGPPQICADHCQPIDP
jgi:hypothetical protein